MAPPTSAREIFSRNGPSVGPSPVIKAIRAVYLEKLFEGEERDDATIHKSNVFIDSKSVYGTDMRAATANPNIHLQRELLHRIFLSVATSEISSTETSDIMSASTSVSAS